MNIFECRWKNAVRIAQKINNYLTADYLVFNEHNELITHKFQITEKDIMLLTPDGKVLYFLRDSDYDEGMYTKIKDYNAKFAGWKVVKKQDMIPIVKRRKP